jgi:hypothetical protein
VAISRVRSIEGLYLEAVGQRALLLHPEVVEKDAELKRRSEMARDRFMALMPEERQQLEQNFLRAIGAREPKPIEQKVLSQLEKTREKYPNAGRPWSKEDDETLKEMFTSNAPQKEIGVHFGRKPSAIHSRLAHLGLIEDDYWVNRRKKEQATQNSL